jgi:GMP synthase (glutamine-hydrolysing)
MRVLVILHMAEGDAGVFADAIAAVGASVDQWYPPAGKAPPSDPTAYDAVITLGGPAHVHQQDAHPWIAAELALLTRLLDSGTAILGVCLGAQLLAAATGARVGPAPRSERGWYRIQTTDAARRDPLLAPLMPGFDALEWHSDEFGLPAGAVLLARSDTCLQAFRLGARAWGIQFHADAAPDALESWIEASVSGEEAVHTIAEAEQLRERTRVRIGPWTAAGKELCARFLELA